MKIKFFALSFLLLLFIAGVAQQQPSNMQQFLKDAKAKADAIKKSSPNQPQQPPGLPQGDDNSWKIMVSFTRTAIASSNLTSISGCRSTSKSSNNFSLQGNLSSDQVIAFTNGDDFQLITVVDDDLKKFMHPLKGSYTLQSMGHASTTSCDGSSNAEESGNGNFDPAAVNVSFNYNKKRKEGDFQISQPDNYSIQANGKLTVHTKDNPSTTLNTADHAKASIEMMFAVCGIIFSWNHPVTKDTKTEQALISSPVNGGQASIAQTKNGYEISYSFSKTVSETPTGFSGSSEITYTTSVHILITNQQPPTLEAIIDPLDATAYQNFIPEGPKVDGSTTDGNSISFRIRIIDKKNGGKDVTSSHPFTVTYTLDHVSKYKGICMNYPKQNADEQPDLRWDRLSKAQTHLKSFTESTLVSNTREGDQLSAYITSYDYAAFGILKAQVHLDDDDLDLDAHIKDKPEEFFADIPIDENHNKIADKWEKDVDMYAKTADADFDEDEFPKNQKRNGDGYTLFEEYRGFKVKDNLLASGSHESFKNGFLRMDPDYKDIFINDEDGLFQTYYASYNPSDLCWHYIDKDEMIFNSRGKDPENRWTNFNKVEEHFYARQYALILEKKPGLLPDGEVGHALSYVRLADYDTKEAIDDGMPVTTHGFDQAVKNTIVVDVYVEEVTWLASHQRTGQQKQNYYNDIVAGTVIHEIGHAIGITHHLRPDGSTDSVSLTLGVTDCSMRYESKDEEMHNMNMLLVRYCKKGETWKEVVQPSGEGTEAPGATVPLKTITHPSNNCYGQIDIKSDPG